MDNEKPVDEKPKDSHDASFEHLRHGSTAEGETLETVLGYKPELQRNR
jgi:hypothetical protein